MTDSSNEPSLSITSDDDISERWILYTVLFRDTELGLNVVKIISTNASSDECDINPLAPELFYFNFNTSCIQNVNNTGTKQVSIMKQTAF